MRNLSLDYHTRVAAGHRPAIYAIIHTSMGDRVYGDRVMDPAIVQTELVTVSGEPIVIKSTGEPILVTLENYTLSAITVEDRIERFSGLSKTLTPTVRNLLTSWVAKRQAQVSIELANPDYAVTRAIAQEPFLKRSVAIRAGFDDVRGVDHLQLFSGVIDNIDVGSTTVTLDVVEGAALADTLYLTRADTYSSPLNGNDKLPIVYGDLTDGSAGIWQIPCIDTANYVYAFAGHEVLSVANGNSISVYVDDVLTPAGWTFNHSNDYEGQGTIATITFSADQANKTITVKGKGKPTASGGSTLMTNVADIVYDYLTAHCGVSGADIHTTAKTQAYNKFAAQGYAAAGCIIDDRPIWETLAQMMGSFLGSAWIDGDGLLVLDLDDGSTPVMAETIHSDDINLRRVSQKSENLVNRLRAAYKYNYKDGEFKGQSDGVTYQDGPSISTHGECEPDAPLEAFWCRSSSAIDAITQIVVAKQAAPVWEIEFIAATAEYLHLDLGDVVGLSAPQIFSEYGQAYSKQLFRIVGIKTDLDRQMTTFVAHDLRTPYTEIILHQFVTKAGEPIIINGYALGLQAGGALTLQAGGHLALQSAEEIHVEVAE